MTKFSDKLSRLSMPSRPSVPRVAEGAAIPEAPVKDRVAALRGMLDQMMARDLPRDTKPAVRSGEARVLPGYVRESAHGTMRVVERYCEPAHCHGRVPIARALQADAALVAKLALDEALYGCDMRGMLFVDTETTGLAGGAGTIPFLIGMAWFEDESLHVEQLFLERPGEERPMLHALAERLAKATCLVSYNGKSFDWPLLRTRFVLNRIPVPVLPPHLDLLHCARRVWKRRLQEVRLQQLEREVLGHHRGDDEIEGSEIPLAYLAFLRGDFDARISAIIEHNGDDLIALSAVLVALLDRFESVRDADDPREHLSLAHLAQRADDRDRAAKFALAASTSGMNDVATEAFQLIAKLRRAAGDHSGELDALSAALSHCADGDVRATLHLSLAKVFEHRMKNYEQALHHAERARDLEGQDASLKRIARLKSRFAAKL